MAGGKPKTVFEFPISSDYNHHVSTGRPGGTDFLTPYMSPVCIPEGGWAKYLCDQYGGLFIDVYVDNSIMIRLLHLDPKDFIIGKEKRVEPYQVLGYADNTGWSTGHHTHVEVWKDDKRIDPILYINQVPMNRYVLSIEKKLADGSYKVLAFPWAEDRPDDKEAIQFFNFYTKHTVSGFKIRLKKDNKTYKHSISTGAVEGDSTNNTEALSLIERLKSLLIKK